MLARAASRGSVTLAMSLSAPLSRLIAGVGGVGPVDARGAGCSLLHDVGQLDLRHENAVLRHQIGRIRYQAADLGGLLRTRGSAVLSALRSGAVASHISRMGADRQHTNHGSAALVGSVVPEDPPS